MEFIFLLEIQENEICDVLLNYTMFITVSHAKF